LSSKWVRTTVQRLGLAACACLLLACASRPPILEPEPPVDNVSVAGEHYTVALLGATGMVGGYLLQEALSRGHTVRALARTPAKLDAWRGQITIIEGDARDPAIIEQLLRGSDVVINALGPVKADGNASRGINTAVTANILHALEGKAISRYMVVSGAAVVMPGDERNLLGWWIRKLAQVGLHNTLQDKQAEYELLAASSAHWVLVRCPLIDAESFVKTPLSSLKTPPAFRVRAGELAYFMIEQIESRDFVRQGPFLGSH
jgi:hypothetical protein